MARINSWQPFYVTCNANALPIMLCIIIYFHVLSFYLSYTAWTSCHAHINSRVSCTSISCHNHHLSYTVFACSSTWIIINIYPISTVHNPRIHTICTYFTYSDHAYILHVFISYIHIPRIHNTYTYTTYSYSVYIYHVFIKCVHIPRIHNMHTYTTYSYQLYILHVFISCMHSSRIHTKYTYFTYSYHVYKFYVFMSSVLIPRILIKYTKFMYCIKYT